MNTLSKLISILTIVALAACSSDETVFTGSPGGTNGSPTDPAESGEDPPVENPEPVVFVDKSLRPPAEFFE